VGYFTAMPRRRSRPPPPPAASRAPRHLLQLPAVAAMRLPASSQAAGATRAARGGAATRSRTHGAPPWPLQSS
jgi:hypothetical protein